MAKKTREPGRFVTLRSGRVIFIPKGYKSKWADVRDRIKRSAPRGAAPIDGKWPSKGALEGGIEGGTIEYGETYVLDIGGVVYEVKTEGWWGDCLESRGLCATSIDAVRDTYKGIMVAEAGWARADIAGYVEETEQGPTFGISYIGRRVGAS